MHDTLMDIVVDINLTGQSGKISRVGAQGHAKNIGNCLLGYWILVQHIVWNKFNQQVSLV